MNGLVFLLGVLLVAIAVGIEFWLLPLAPGDALLIVTTTVPALAFIAAGWNDALCVRLREK